MTVTWAASRTSLWRAALQRTSAPTWRAGQRQPSAGAAAATTLPPMSGPRRTTRSRLMWRALTTLPATTALCRRPPTCRGTRTGPHARRPPRRRQGMGLWALTDTGLKLRLGGQQPLQHAAAEWGSDGQEKELLGCDDVATQSCNRDALQLPFWVDQQL